jgi:hypothetical protein
MTETKIFGVGLPRSAGQTLQAALTELLQVPVWHSPGRNWTKLPEDFTAAVEVFAPIPHLLNEYPDCKIILNVRDVQSWLASCEAVYDQSQGWNNPLWFHPFDQFEAYYHEYVLSRGRFQYALGDRMLVTDFTQESTWTALANFLECDDPAVPFPNLDRVRRGPRDAMAVPDPNLVPLAFDDWRINL